MTILISEQEIEQILSIRDAIPVIEEAFRLAGSGLTENPPRLRMPIREGFLQLGPAAIHPRQVMGFKLWANFGSPLRQVWNFLFDIETSELVAIVQAHRIGTFRTSATSAVAAKYLSPPEAATIGMYGSGRQAEAQLEAICAVRPIRSAVVYSRTRDKCEAFCRRAAQRLGIAVTPAASPEAVPRDAAIIVTITSSATPVLRGEWLTGQALVIAAGANHWHEREIDQAVVERAKLVVVDGKEQAKIECGDLLHPISHGVLTWERVEELGDVVVGRVPLPDLRKELILFESHGLALEDVAISARAHELARAKGLGREISL
jgi:alanine dehydrogenase